MPWPWVQYPVRFCKTPGAAGEEKKRCTLVSSSILGRLFNFCGLRRNPTPALLTTVSASAGVFPWGNTLSMLLSSLPRKSRDKPATPPALFFGAIRKAFSFELRDNQAHQQHPAQLCPIQAEELGVGMNIDSKQRQVKGKSLGRLGYWFTVDPAGLSRAALGWQPVPRGGVEGGSTVQDPVLPLSHPYPSPCPMLTPF